MQFVWLYCESDNLSHRFMGYLPYYFRICASRLNIANGNGDIRIEISAFLLRVDGRRVFFAEMSR